MKGYGYSVISYSHAHTHSGLTLSPTAAEGNLNDSIGCGGCGWWVEPECHCKSPPPTGMVKTQLTLAHIYTN